MRQSEGHPQPLLHWLLRKYPDTPKTRAKQWILAGRVRVRGEVIRRPQEPLLDPGDTLELLARQAENLDVGLGWHIHPQLTLVYLDSAVGIVNKGPGLLSVPAPNRDVSALTILEDFLAGRLRARVSGRTLPPPYRRLRPLRVHRLDEYTSGVFCVAMNPEARAGLIEQVRAHTMRREYIAFVEGKAPRPQGVWRHWLWLSPTQGVQQVVARPPAGATAQQIQEARTQYEVLAEYPLAVGPAFISKLRLVLETGLKHQIRIQAAHTGLPLVGDRTYNPHYRGKAASSGITSFARQALHASRLELAHPDRPNHRMSWDAPLPTDLQQLEAALQGQI
jgi:23S rRNA pseudouridine1911/1915/1917 synthase